jgi:RHS repeat-associated protein
MTSGMPDVFTATYDASNRMIYVENPTQSRRTWYEYDAGNKRVYEKRVDGSTQEWFHYYGITGQRLARYSFTVSGAVITFAEHENSVWFGGKLVRNAGSWTNEDRLGSVGKYLPYGEDKPGASGNPANDSAKFATYTRDAGTGIDYADQRWHAQGVGRFLTSDPYQASAGPGDPGSWNRYGYVQGDPLNFGDPNGLLRRYCSQDGETEMWNCSDAGDTYGDGGGDEGQQSSDGQSGNGTGPETDALVARALAEMTEDCKNLLSTVLAPLRPDDQGPRNSVLAMLQSVAPAVGVYDLRLQSNANLSLNDLIARTGATYRLPTELNHRVALILAPNWAAAPYSGIGGRLTSLKAVVLTDKFYGQETRSQNGMMLHELLHVVFTPGTSDPRNAHQLIAHALGITTSGSDEDWNRKLTEELTKRCYK